MIRQDNSFYNYNRTLISNIQDHMILMDYMELPTEYQMLKYTSLEYYIDEYVPLAEFFEEDELKEDFDLEIDTLVTLLDNDVMTENELLDYLDNRNFSVYDFCDNEKIIYMKDEYIENVLMYNTVYSPYKEDEDIAIEVGLPFFYFKDEFFLALGTIGMDMSPKLDAYQFLTSNSLPSSSQWYNELNQEYFRYVVGSEVYNKMKKLAKKENKESLSC